MRNAIALLALLVLFITCTSGAVTTMSKTKKVRCAFGLPLDSGPFKGKSHAEAAKLLTEMGVDSVCACPQNAELIEALHAAGIKAYAEISVFIGKQHWEAHPESHPINSDGKPIAAPVPGYCGVCPNQEWLRKELLDKVSKRFQEFEYDGLWLDFIRYPGRWEGKEPVLEECCFCDVCLTKFAKSKGIAYPTDLKSTHDKAHWILAKHRAAWTQFKCDTITNFAAQLKQTMQAQRPYALLAIFNVPWTKDEFSGAVINQLGQDIKALAKYVDVYSPMVYHLYCQRPMNWIADYTNWVHKTTGKAVWPIVQTVDEPEGTKMSGDEVYRTLRTGLDAAGSDGVMPFTFASVVENPAKLEALKKVFVE